MIGIKIDIRIVVGKTQPGRHDPVAGGRVIYAKGQIVLGILTFGQERRVFRSIVPVLDSASSKQHRFGIQVHLTASAHAKAVKSEPLHTALLRILGKPISTGKPLPRPGRHAQKHRRRPSDRHPELPASDNANQNTEQKR